MTEQQYKYLQDQTRQLCAERGIVIIGYGRSWWLVGQGVSLVVADLAGVRPSDLKPWPVANR